MIGKIGNEINNSGGKFIEYSKMPTKNIYLKIAPPNTFKRRNTNQTNKPKIFQRYEKTSQSNQVSNPYINFNNSNFPKRTIPNSIQIGGKIDITIFKAFAAPSSIQAIDKK